MHYYATIFRTEEDKHENFRVIKCQETGKLSLSSGSCGAIV